MEKILLSGGSGLLGTQLASFLESRQYATAILSRKKGDRSSYHWDPAAGKMDEVALDNCFAILHLAGAGIADKRWTAQRKKEILDSRTKSTDLLFEALRNNKHRIETIVSASAIGIYGDGRDEWKTEKSEIGEGFLEDTCRAWEKSVRRFEELRIRVVILRIGIVLAKEGGALPVMALPVKLFAGSPLGSGKQFISWIHIDDLSRIFLHALDNKEMRGVYNAVASSPVRNKEFYQVLSKNLRRPLWPLHVPSFLLKRLLGEKAELVLQGQRVSNKKLTDSGFSFNYTELSKAIASFHL